MILDIELPVRACLSNAKEQREPGEDEGVFEEEINQGWLDFELASQNNSSVVMMRGARVQITGDGRN
jgi:hypothetical protein